MKVKDVIQEIYTTTSINWGKETDVPWGHEPSPPFGDTTLNDDTTNHMLL